MYTSAPPLPPFVCLFIFMVCCSLHVVCFRCMYVCRLSVCLRVCACKCVRALRVRVCVCVCVCVCFVCACMCACMHACMHPCLCRCICVFGLLLASACMCELWNELRNCFSTWHTLNTALAKHALNDSVKKLVHQWWMHSSLCACYSFLLFLWDERVYAI